MPLLVTAKSQTVITGVEIVVLLFAEKGSLVAEDTDEFAVIDATVMLLARFTTTMIAAELPLAMLGVVQVTFPVPPIAGVVQVQPAGAETEAKVVLAGTASVKFTVVATAGPLLVTVWI